MNTSGGEHQNTFQPARCPRGRRGTNWPTQFHRQNKRTPSREHKNTFKPVCFRWPARSTTPERQVTATSPPDHGQNTVRTPEHRQNTRTPPERQNTARTPGHQPSNPFSRRWPVRSTRQATRGAASNGGAAPRYLSRGAAAAAAAAAPPRWAALPGWERHSWSCTCEHGAVKCVAAGFCW
jgi:hypothetical protein